MNLNEEALQKHFKWKGKIETKVRAPLTGAHDLSLAYTPGVAEACLAIQKDPALSFQLTRRWNTVAVITDGTAVLGLGDIGPEAGMPVMEGKCALFKHFGNIDAFPLCIGSHSVDEIVSTIHLISGSFGGLNVEDISAPRCFDIEEKLKEKCDIPVFHDDQHGTAVVTLAGLTNALKLTGKRFEDIRIAISGAGAAGDAIARLLLKAGVKDITLCNSKGAVNRDTVYEKSGLEKLKLITNPRNIKGSLSDVVAGADVFIGVSAPGVLTGEMVKTMAKDPIIFAMANPVPEIMPDEAFAAGAKIVCTGRSDFPNQINNVLAFPGIFRGALDVRASDINEEMKLAAANALAQIISEDKLAPDHVIPSIFEENVCGKIAAAVADAAVKSGIARI